jgi:integrase
MVRRGFGALRKLPSKRWQASYIDPRGSRRAAPNTFSARIDAEGWLNSEHRLIESGEWLPPEKRRNHRVRKQKGITLREYSEAWLAQSPIRETTKVLYERLLRLRILPTLGGVPLETISKPQVATWWRGLDHSKKRTCDMAYSLLRTICYAAEGDGLIEANPCKVKGAGAASRQVDVEPLTPAQVQLVAAEMPEPWQIGVILGAWCMMRSGEVRECRRKDPDFKRGGINVSRGVVRVGGELIAGELKTKASRRTAPMPESVAEQLREHLNKWAQIGDEGLLIYDPKTGKQVDDNTWRRAWISACKKAGIAGYRFHDLRHTGLTYMAVAGATIKELQAVAGHTTPAMAMRYQEVASSHLAQVVQNLDALISADNS